MNCRDKLNNNEKSHVFVDFTATGWIERMFFFLWDRMSRVCVREVGEAGSQRVRWDPIAGGRLNGAEVSLPSHPYGIVSVLHKLFDIFMSLSTEKRV